MFEILSISIKFLLHIFESIYWLLNSTKYVGADMKFWNLVFSYMKTIEINVKIILIGPLAFTVSS